MNPHSLKRRFCSVGNNIFYSVTKGLFFIVALSRISDTQVVSGADFKSYLKGAQAEILRHKDLVREDPLDAIAYFELGRAYLALGKHKEEAEAYRKAIQLNYKYISAHYNLSIAYDFLKDGPNAIKHMLHALNLSFEKRNHVRVRNMQRQLKRLFLKYPDKPSGSESQN